MLKIDMSKAYDRVDWRFLAHVLQTLGIPDCFRKLIDNCVSTPWFSIMMYNTYLNFFKSKRGLRQGDPLLPYLFIIMEEVFSRLLNKRMSERGIQPFSHPVSAQRINHLLYADDVVVYLYGSRKSVRCLMGVLKDYECWSGQGVNYDKSAIFFSKHQSCRRTWELLAKTSFSEGHFCSFPFHVFGGFDSGWSTTN